jgi:hypothetical protein
MSTLTGEILDSLRFRIEQLAARDKCKVPQSKNDQVLEVT